MAQLRDLAAVFLSVGNEGDGGLQGEAEPARTSPVFNQSWRAAPANAASSQIREARVGLGGNKAAALGVS